MSPLESRFYAIVLAAGIAARMGRDKASLPWLGDHLLLEWMVDALSTAGWRPIVVVGPHNNVHWVEKIPHVSVVLNSRSALGKTTSIAAGLEALPSDFHSVLITGVDQPRPPELYRLMREEAEEHSPIISVPEKDGKNGHPVVFGQIFKEQLSHLSENEKGLRGLLQEHGACIHRLPCDSDWLRWDVNTPEEYDEALEWFRSRAS